MTCIFEHISMRMWEVAFLPKSLSCPYPVLTAVIFISCSGLMAHGLILHVVINYQYDDNRRSCEMSIGMESVNLKIRYHAETRNF